MCPDDLQPGNPIDGINGQRETIDLILDRKFHRSVDIALLLVTTNVQVPIVGPA